MAPPPPPEPPERVSLHDCVVTSFVPDVDLALALSPAYSLALAHADTLSSAVRSFVRSFVRSAVLADFAFLRLRRRRRKSIGGIRAEEGGEDIAFRSLVAIK